jgi:hypothetical protein
MVVIPIRSLILEKQIMWLLPIFLIFTGLAIWLWAQPYLLPTHWQPLGWMSGFVAWLCVALLLTAWVETWQIGLSRPLDPALPLWVQTVQNGQQTLLAALPVRRIFIGILLAIPFLLLWRRGWATAAVLAWAIWWLLVAADTPRLSIAGQGIVLCFTYLLVGWIASQKTARTPWTVKSAP